MIETILYLLIPVLTGVIGILIEKYAPDSLRAIKLGSNLTNEFLPIIEKSKDSNKDLLKFAQEQGLKIAAKKIEKYLNIED